MIHKSFCYRTFKINSPTWAQRLVRRTSSYRIATHYTLQYEVIIIRSDLKEH